MRIVPHSLTAAGTAAGIGLLFTFSALGVGGCTKPQSSPPPTAVATPAAVVPPEQARAFLDTLRGLPVDQRRSYVQQHQQLAIQVWHNPDPGVSSEYTKLMTQGN